MDPRTHVARALVRLLAAPGPLPPRGTAEFRNRLLDETGGDFRPLVQFLLQLADAGLVDDLEAAAARGERWDETHRRLAMAWTAEHYSQPEMARWAVAAWGAALGRCPVPDDPPPPLTAPAHAAHTTGASPPRGTAAGRTTAQGTPPTRSPLPRSQPGHAAVGRIAAPGARRPYLNAAERRALAAIGVTGLVAAALIATMSPFVGADDMPAAPAAAVTDRAATVAPAVDSSGATPQRAVPPGAVSPGDAPRDATASSLPATGAPPAPASEAPGAPEDRPDELAISRFSAAAGAARLGGVYRLTVHRQGIYGDDRCTAIGAAIDWNQRSIDTIAVDVDAATFRFISRPSLDGRMAEGGVFASRIIVTERDGTRSSFRLQGQLTPWGFQATGDTRTVTMLRWRRTVHCQFVAALSGERLP